jgi:hypothetical protein
VHLAAGRSVRYRDLVTSTTPPAAASSPEAVTQALLDLGRDPQHPFTVAVEGERIVARWVWKDAQGMVGSARSSYALRITLLPETHEYKRSELNTESSAGTVSGTYTFSSAKVVGPVKETLEAHGWHRRRSALGKALGGLFS